MIPLKGGHSFAGDADALARAVEAKCARCGAVVKDRFGSITSLPCPLASAAAEPAAATVQDELRALVDEAREQGRAEERSRAAKVPPGRVWTAAEVATIRADALAEGESRGRDVERGRVLRLLNVAFTGKALDTDLSAAIVKLCQDVARGRDVTS